ncbi:lipocalin family protein [Rhodoferax sp. TBRC 17198]|nr:lipocalin family protein [Rhodoferax sp. TBRC 17198]MDT7521641.1 lipocalin family protein [Rhodoferax sp. TBRC 17198]
MGTAMAHAQPTALQPIASLDVPRYMGTWYEIAKYPNSFQKKCVRNTRADYQAQPDGSVQVLNRCVTADGQTTEALGAARQVGPSNSPKLQVRFAPAWLSFLPMVWGDYWVIDLDPQYQLVAVSEPKREYLWVLSRSPKVESAAYQALLTRLGQQGFDLKRLELSPQE